MSLSKLEDALQESISPLEHELAMSGFTNGSEESLQLRYSACGIATGALQQFLQRKYKLKTERLLAQPPLAPREVNSRKMSHVVLVHEGYVIDPTYSQFLSYVGLNPTRVSSNEELRQFYPSTKIAVFDSQATSTFTDTFSEHAYSIASDVERLAIDKSPPIEPTNALVRATLPELKEVYEDIWTIGHYTPFPIEEQTNMHQVVIRIADNMLSC